MRFPIFALPLMLIAAPAAAAPAQPVPQLPPELTDPAMAEKLGRISGALAHSLMDLPVGEIEAAIEGRPVTPADKAKRVRDAVGDPNMEQHIAAEAAASGQAMQAATKALAASLPAIMAAMSQAQHELERAVANLPDPTYPKR